MARTFTGADFRSGQNEQGLNRPFPGPYQTNSGLTLSVTKAKTWCWTMTSACRKSLMAGLSSPMKDSWAA